jgi:DNA-binding Xre family transcriptional regulator
MESKLYGNIPSKGGMLENGGMTVKWKVKEFLDSFGKTPYALWKASGLSRNQTYAIVNGQQDGLRFEGLSKLIFGLEKLTGQEVTPNDVLEVVRDGKT